MLGNWDEFVEYPKNNEEPEQVTKKEPVEKPITNGDLVAEAIRTRDNVLKMEMERRFLQWCDETHHTPYSAGDKKIWKKQPYTQDY